MFSKIVRYYNINLVTGVCSVNMLILSLLLITDSTNSYAIWSIIVFTLISVLIQCWCRHLDGSSLSHYAYFLDATKGTDVYKKNVLDIISKNYFSRKVYDRVSNKHNRYSMKSCDTPSGDIYTDFYKTLVAFYYIEFGIDYKPLNIWLFIYMVFTIILLVIGG